MSLETLERSFAWVFASRDPEKYFKGFGTKLPRRRRKSLETFNVPRLTGGFVR
jgi:hypothetical protein